MVDAVDVWTGLTPESVPSVEELFAELADAGAETEAAGEAHRAAVLALEASLVRMNAAKAAELRVVSRLKYAAAQSPVIR